MQAEAAQTEAALKGDNNLLRRAQLRLQGEKAVAERRLREMNSSVEALKVGLLQAACCCHQSCVVCSNRIMHARSCRATVVAASAGHARVHCMQALAWILPPAA
jgi:hypothetical protein